jgi:hypothetical protein
VGRRGGYGDSKLILQRFIALFIKKIGELVGELDASLGL